MDQHGCAPEIATVAPDVHFRKQLTEPFAHLPV
jgi:hypothetical protein